MNQDGKCRSRYLLRYFLIFFFVAPLCAAKTLYVSPTGDDATAEPDNRERPFKSMPAAFGSLENGDRLEILEGQYTITPGYPTSSFPQPDYAPMRVDGLSNVVVAGVGDVEIYGEGPGDFLMIQNSSKIRVENITFKGNRPSIPEDNNGALFSTIQLRGTNDALHFENCRIIGFGDHGISHLWGAKTSFNMVVTNCYFTDGGDGNYALLGEDGAAVSGISSGARIMNNTIERCFRGIEVEGVFEQKINDVLIEGNILTNCHSLGIMLFATDHLGLNRPDSFSNIRVLNNRISNMSVHSDSPTNHLMWGIWLLGGQKLQISGNWVENLPRWGLGISVTSSQMGVSDVVITSNVVTNVTLRGIQVYQQFSNTLQNAQVNYNRVIGAADEGILLNGRNIECRGNYLEDTGWQGSRGSIGVNNLYLGTEGVTIADNVILNRNNFNSDYGIWLDGPTNCVVYGNTFQSVPLGAIRDDGKNSSLLPKVKEVEPDDTGADLAITGTPGTKYRVEASFNLSSWILVEERTCPTSGIFNCEYIANPLRIAVRPTFFRVLSVPTPPE